MEGISMGISMGKRENEIYFATFNVLVGSLIMYYFVITNK
jgi:hypothetical protein